MIQMGGKVSVMKYKLIYSGVILLIYIFGRCIPLYGVDSSVYSFADINAEEVLMQTISGDMYRYSVFALGLSPCILSSILVQIIMACRNSVSKARISPGKLGRMTAAMTLVIATIQALVRVAELEFTVVSEGNLIPVEVLAATEMVAGVMVILWLSERNTRYGIGGRVILILVNILDGIISTLTDHKLQNLVLPLFVSGIVMIAIIIMENAEKRIPVQRISIHNIYADKNYMAIKLNPVGVMPVMFSTALFMVPQFLVFVLRMLFPDHSGIIWWQENMTLNNPLGIGIYVLCIYLLTIGFAMVLVSPKDITEQFLKSGDSIVDIHAGRDTRRYLRGVVWRISLCSATAMGICVTVPLILQVRGNIDGTLAMLPSSVMMMTGLWCNLYREGVVIRNYDSYQPLL